MRNGKLFPIVNDRFHSLKKSKLISEKDKVDASHHISTGNCCIKISYTRFWFRTRNAISSADPSILRRIFEYIFFFIFVCPFNSISSTVKYVLEIALFRRSFIDSSLLRSCLYYVSSAALCGGFFCSASQAAAQSVHSTSRPACVI